MKKAVLLATILLSQISFAQDGIGNNRFSLTCVRTCVLDMDDSKYCEVKNSQGKLDTFIYFTSSSGEHIEMSSRAYENIETVLLDLPPKVQEDLEKFPDSLKCSNQTTQIDVTPQPAFGSQL